MPDHNSELIETEPPPEGAAVRLRRALSRRAIGARLRHPIARNAAVLYVQQAASYVLPIITIPYLARVLGPHAWGVVVFAQGFSNWLARLLEYGFNLSATRDVAGHRSDKERVAGIVSGVLGAQVLLAVAAGVAAIVAGLTVPSFQGRTLYLVLAWLAAITQGANPLWFYQGFEDMRLPALLSVAARVIATAGIFFLVNSPADGWIVLALQVAGGFASSGIAIGSMYRRVPARMIRFRSACAALVQGWRVFLLRGSITL
jgi:PST family polysaccharide transporter